MHINTASIHTAMLSFLRSFLLLEANQKKKTTNWKSTHSPLTVTSREGKKKEASKRKKWARLLATYIDSYTG